MGNISSNSSKFSQVSLTDDQKFNFIVNVENYIIDLPEEFKKSKDISEIIYENLNQRNSRFEVLYGLRKVQKQWLITVELLHQLFQLSKHL